MAVLNARQYRDTLTGTSENDSITGSPGADHLIGGPGADTILSATSFGEWYTPDILRGGAGDDVISVRYGYGAFAFGDNGDDTLSGSDLTPPQSLVVLEGGPGDDRIDGMATAGERVLAGYVTATGGVTVNLAVPTAQAVGGGAGVDILRSLTGLVGSSHDDILRGGDNTPNLLFGGAGDDRIEAGAGGATMWGEQGNDTLVGGADEDWVSYAGSIFSEPEFAYLSRFEAVGGVHAEMGTLSTAADSSGLGRDLLIDIDGVEGTRFSDTLIGDSRDNTLAGGSGEDLLEGGGGNDSLAGLHGSDTLRGGLGNDTISDNSGPDRIEGGDGDDLITTGNVSLPFPPGGPPPGIADGNAGADTLIGFNHQEWFRGGQGNDSLSSGGGDDFLSGDKGNDTISGGAGADIFHSFSGAGLDRILDFNAAEGDRVQLATGTSYTVSQVGADTVVDLGGGDTVVLVGVQMSALLAGWITVA